jgi:hypothetical protein
MRRPSWRGVAGVAVVLVVLAACSDAAPPPLKITTEPSTYSIVYRETRPGGKTNVDELSVSRPFVSATRTERSAFGRLVTALERDEPLVLSVGPGLAAGDVRIAPVLDDAVEAGLLVPRGRHEVAGRACQEYRTGSAAASGLLKAPTEREHVDLCISASGLPLSETSSIDGKVVRRRVATSITAGVAGDFGREWIDAKPSVAVGDGGGSILRVADDSAPPGELFELPHAPAGFHHLGRYSVIPANGEAFRGGEHYYEISASTADVWQRGIDVLIVEQGGSLGGRTPFEIDHDNRTLTIEGIGTAEVRLGLAGNEVRARRPGGHWIRVAGTLPADDLVDLMRRLVKTTGSELVVEHGPLLPNG